MSGNFAKQSYTSQTVDRDIGTAFDFEFGSSRGSKEKSVLMAGNRPPGMPE